MITPSTTFTDPICDALCRDIARKSNGVCLLSFSGGKDSVACWVYLQQFFKRIIPLHFASYPRLRSRERMLRYYEDAFGTHIVRMVGEELPLCLSKMMYQTATDLDLLTDLDTPQMYSKLDMYEFVRMKLNLPKAWVAVGISVGDSIDRRIYCKKVEGKNPQNLTFYPLWAVERSDILSIVRNSGLKLSDEYRWQNRSLGGVPSYTCNKIYDEHYHEDFERIQAMYPLALAKSYREMMLDAVWRRRKAEGIVDDDGLSDIDGADVGTDILPEMRAELGEE